MVVNHLVGEIAHQMANVPLHKSHCKNVISEKKNPHKVLKSTYLQVLNTVT